MRKLMIPTAGNDRDKMAELTDHVILENNPVLAGGFFQIASAARFNQVINLP